MWRNHAANDGMVVAVVANLDFLGSCSLHLMLTNKGSNKISRTSHSLLSWRRFLLMCGRTAYFSRPQMGHRHRRPMYQC
ncbi:hypothetical protein Y032_0545g3243 [Ancylostoma ceylanicum]|uniref:Uncharacterized protein n=1 Tax=Ancylostoma ceylanicum TaxID=53326 RepID=A0A016WR60_9BILA|nr:hypothetical protein Y032_0545g3243 [Ancylostoma ceylanicum]